MQQPLPLNNLELSGSLRGLSDVRRRWLGYIGTHVCAYELDGGMPPGSEFQCHARSRTVAGFTLTRIASKTGRFRLVRDADGIARGEAHRYGILLSLRGNFEMTQMRRSQRVAAGGYAFSCSSEPSTLLNSEDGENECIGFYMPRDIVDHRLLHGEDLCARSYAPGTGLHAMVFETVKAFETTAWTVSDDEFQQAARVLTDLILLALSDSAHQPSMDQSVRAANLARVKRLIRRRLSDPELSLQDIAQASGRSLSYLHDLFRDERHTMWEYLKSERLQQARAMLEAARWTRSNITDIALGCGFSNLSYFSKAFKSAFGITPKDAVKNNN